MSALTEHAALVEAIIFASDKPVRERELRHHLPDEVETEAVIALIRQRYGDDSGVELKTVGDGWAFRTKAAFAERLTQHKLVERPLSRAALEVLAIIAYHQPITRAEIEEIRGISLSKGTMDILLELGWIKPRGRRRTPGRPLTWGTSPVFLDHFGLGDVTDLPGIDELKSAGLLRKGQVLGALMDGPDASDDDANDEIDNDDLLGDDLLEEAILEANFEDDPQPDEDTNNA